MVGLKNKFTFKIKPLKIYILTKYIVKEINYIELTRKIYKLIKSNIY